MTLTDKTKKLLGFSLVLKSADKKVWADLLPKMTEKQVQTLYQVLVDEVKAWKKEGISVIPDVAVELSLLPASAHGASVSTLKNRLEGKIPPAQTADVSKPTRKAPEPTTPFGKELQREVTTPELTAPTGMEQPNASPQSVLDQEELIFNQDSSDGLPKNDENAWMVSDQVVVPKIPLGVIQPKPLNVPKIRNRVAKYGLAKLDQIQSADDLTKVESAHLRQGPLAGQISMLREAIIKIAKDTDQLPISLLPMFEKSPLSQTYLKVGMMLIEKNQGDVRVAFDQVMEELESTGEDSLSQAEFEAVADLKKELESIAGI